MNKEDRSLDDIFNSLQTLLVNREVDDLENSKPKEKCLCGLVSDEETSAEEEDEHDISPHEVHEPIYIETKNIKPYFAVCPACNPRLHCRFCQGTGHRVLEMQHTFETEEGSVEFLSEALSPNTCSCTHTEKLVELLNKAQIPPKYMKADINEIHDDHLNQTQKEKFAKNVNKSVSFIKKVSQQLKLNIKDYDEKHFLVLFGPVGSGKTFLSIICLKIAIINYGISARFVDFQYLLSQLKYEYEQKRFGESILKELRNVDVLVIDELGKGRNENEWQLEKLDDLINYRYNAKKITILTTNYLPLDLRYNENEIPKSSAKQGTSFWGDSLKPGAEKFQIPVHESFWMQNLKERIGSRMYERLIEVSEFIDFTNLPSYRRVLGRDFLERYLSTNK